MLAAFIYLETRKLHLVLDIMYYIAYHAVNGYRNLLSTIHRMFPEEEKNHMWEMISPTIRK